MPLLIALVLPFWAVALLTYVRALSKLASYSEGKGLAIFGKRYSGLSALGSDTHFLNHLWAGKGVEDHPDVELIERLKMTRKYLVFQVVLSIGIFFLLMFSAIVKP